MSNKINIGNVVTAFLTEKDVCNTQFGKYISHCEDLHKRFQKEINSPGCTACKKPSIYNKYRLLVRRNIVLNPEPDND